MEGIGVDDGAGGRTRALIVMSPGGGNQLTAIQNLADAPYTVDAVTRKITEVRFPTATTEGFGMARWRQILYRLNAAGFDVLAYDRRGEGLSGGQRQSISLARALAGRPPILLFDEPTSAIDQATEAALIERLKPEVAGRTFLLITHRPALLALVDRVVLVDQGRVVQDGPRDRVLDQLRPRAAA